MTIACHTYYTVRERLRALLCAGLAHAWLMNAGIWATKPGPRRRVDRHKRRQRSDFQIGGRFLQHLLACGRPLRCSLEAHT